MKKIHTLISHSENCCGCLVGEFKDGGLIDFKCNECGEVAGYMIMENKDLLTHITDPKVIHEAAMRDNEEQMKTYQGYGSMPDDTKPCEACGVIHPLTTNCVDDAPFAVKDKKWWEERFAEEFEASGDLEDYDVEDVKAFIHQVEQEAYERGKVDLATDIANS